MNTWLLILTSAIASGIVSNLAGWLMASLKDGKIDNYEWAKGAWTLLFSLVVTGSLVLTGMDPVTAAAWAIPLHMLIKALATQAGLLDPLDPVPSQIPA